MKRHLKNDELKALVKYNNAIHTKVNPDHIKPPDLTPIEISTFLETIKKNSKKKSHRNAPKRLVLCTILILLLLLFSSVGAIKEFFTDITISMLQGKDNLFGIYSSQLSPVEIEAYNKAAESNNDILKPGRPLDKYEVYFKELRVTDSSWLFRYTGNNLMLDFEQSMKQDGNKNAHFFENNSESTIIELDGREIKITSMTNSYGTEYINAIWESETLVYTIDTNLSQRDVIQIITDLKPVQNKSR